MIKTRKYNGNDTWATSMQVTNTVASLTDSALSSLPGSRGSLYLTSTNSIDNEGAETKEAGVYILSVCLECTEHGFTFINIMCIHPHAQNLFLAGVKAQGKQGILI